MLTAPHRQPSTATRNHPARVLAPLLLMVCLLALALNALAQTTATATAEVEVYRPQHQSPQALVTTLQAVYGDDARFSSDGQQLIIRATPAMLTSVRDTLAQIDQPPRRFLIVLSDQPQSANSNVYSTQSRSGRSGRYELGENEVLALSRASEAQTVSGRSPWWTQVSSYTTAADSIELTVSAVASTAYVQVVMHTLANGQHATVKKSIRAELGQWVSLYSGAAPATQSGHTTASTRSRDAGELYIKITAQ